jgi:hypothetical protein
MKPIFLLRLFLDFMAVSLLLTAMAYYAFDNATHEVVGTAMFLLLIAHNIFNRRWYGTIAKGRREARSIIAKTTNLSLLVTMLSLVATSLIISQTVFSFLPFTSTFTMRQIHTLVAYAALIVVGLHLGLHWTRLMGIVKARLGGGAQSRARSYVLRAVAIIIAFGGLHSFFAQEVSAKLLMQRNFEFGDLQMPVATFVLQHVAIVGLFACLMHYALRPLQRRKIA